MILQVPVQGGHEGGRIKVEHHDQIRLFNVCEGSEKCWNLTAFYSDCIHHLEEVTFGWRLALVFNLELETSNILIPSPQSPDLQTFLSVKQVREVLEQWDQFAEGPEFFVLLLDHRYAPSEFNFHGLKGRDRLLFQLLRSIDCVHLRLANMLLYDDGTNLGHTIATDDEEDETDMESDSLSCSTRNGSSSRYQFDDSIENVLINEVKICNLTDLDGTVSKCPGITIVPDFDVIHFNRPLFTTLEKNHLDSKKNDDDPEPNTPTLHRQNVLVVWSRSETLYMILTCDFDAQLTQLEAKPNIEVLSRVIQFCCEHSDRVWSECDERAERTRRLIQLCIDLKAKEDGLNLLGGMATEFSSTIESDIFVDCEGIRSKEIAIGIAKLIILIGSDACSSVIDKLVKFNRVMEQIENYAYLVIALLEFGVPDCAKHIGNRVCSFLFSQVHKLMTQLPIPAMVACASMILHMQGIEGSGPFRLKSFFDSIKTLPLQKLFPIIAGVEKTCSKHAKERPDCREFLRSLQRKLATSTYPGDLAIDVMLFFLQLDDSILLKEFVNYTVDGPPDILSKIVASPDVWNIALSTLGGKWALRLFFETRIEHLQWMTMPVFTWMQPIKLDIDPQVEAFFRSNAIRKSFSGFTSKNVAEKWIEEFFGRDQIKNGYSAEAAVEEREPGDITCVVTKNRLLYQSKLDKFLKSRTELIALRDRGRRRLGEENVKIDAPDAFGLLSGRFSIKRRRTESI